MNQEVAHEIDVRDALLHQEQDLTRRLKAEIVRAKDVLMSSEMSMKAHAVFKSLVTVSDDEKILLDHGSLRELLDREETKRQKF